VSLVAVTLSGEVWTLDAWTGSIRGSFSSGSAVVSSSTPVRDAGGIGPMVIPGLDGVLFSMSSDGQLTVLPSSAPDLVLEPRMSCLSLAEGDIVEDAGCSLLIGEKTTQVYRLDVPAGGGSKVGSSGTTSSSSSSCNGRTAATAGAAALLLQRDDYVVRALDTATAVELWNVTVAHFTALDTGPEKRATAINMLSGLKPAGLLLAPGTNTATTLQCSLAVFDAFIM
jgi:outer membrane protein assembly factor BamB